MITPIELKAMKARLAAASGPLAPIDPALNLSALDALHPGRSKDPRAIFAAYVAQDMTRLIAEVEELQALLINVRLRALDKRAEEQKKGGVP